MHHLLFLLLSFVWGSNFILMKKASLAFGPLTVSAGRVTGGAIMLAMVWQLQKDKHWPFKKSDWLALSFVVFFGFIWPYTTQPYLIGKFGESGFFALVISLVPLMTIIVSVPMLRVLPTVRQTIGVMGGLGFIALLFYDGLFERSITPGGLALAVTVPLCYATVNTFVKRRFAHVAPMSMACICLFLSAIVMVPAGVSNETIQTDHENFPLAVGAMIVFGLIGTGVSTFMFYRLLMDRGPLWASMTAYLVPVVGLAWGWVDHEIVTLTQVIAFAGILTMVALVQFERRMERAVDVDEPLLES